MTNAKLLLARAVKLFYNISVIDMKKLKELRKSMGYTCAQMGEMLGMCTAFYWQIENKKRGLYYNTAKKIAKIFNLKPDDLFYDEEID